MLMMKIKLARHWDFSDDDEVLLFMYSLAPVADARQYYESIISMAKQNKHG